MSLRRPFALKPVAQAARVLARPVYKKYGLAEGAIAENWAEIVGEEWARASSPRHLNRASRTLTLRVSGARAPELAHLEREIIGRINAFAGRELVARLKLVQGPVTPVRRISGPPPFAGEVSRSDGGGSHEHGAGGSPLHRGACPLAALRADQGAVPLPRERGRNDRGAAPTIQSESLKSALGALGAAIATRGAIKSR